MHGRAVDARLLEGAALDQQARDAAPAARALPLLFGELAAPVERAEEARDLVVHGHGPRAGARLVVARALGGDPLLVVLEDAVLRGLMPSGAPDL